jgi:hypothetical protein
MIAHDTPGPVSDRPGRKGMTKAESRWLLLSGCVVLVVNTAANSLFWHGIHPRGAEYTQGYPLTWWLGLYAVPFTTAVVLGWMAASSRVFPLVVIPILAGLVAQGFVTTGLGLPGSGRAPVVPPGNSFAGSVIVGTVLWTACAALGAVAFRATRRVHFGRGSD